MRLALEYQCPTDTRVIITNINLFPCSLDDQQNKSTLRKTTQSASPKWKYLRSLFLYKARLRRSRSSDLRCLSFEFLVCNQKSANSSAFPEDTKEKLKSREMHTAAFLLYNTQNSNYSGKTTIQKQTYLFTQEENLQIETHHNNEDANKYCYKVNKKIQSMLDVVKITPICPLNDHLGVEQHVSYKHKQPYIQLQPKSTLLC